MKKDAKQLVKDAEAAGYVHVGTNSKGALRFEHPQRQAFLLPPSGGEHAIRQIRTALGLCDAGPKRNATAVRERQAKDRQRQQQQLAKHRQVLLDLRREKDRLLAGHGAALTHSQVAAIERQIEAEQRHHDELSRLLTAVPAGSSHCGTARPARHQAGQR